MAENTLFEEGRWRVVTTAESPEYAEIWHGCDVDIIEYAYTTTGHKKCDGCEEEIPEKITTIATMYRKGVPDERPTNLITKGMQAMFMKAFLKDIKKNTNRLMGITSE